MTDATPTPALQKGDRVRLIKGGIPMRVDSVDEERGRAWCVTDDGSVTSLPISALHKLARRGFAAMSPEKQAEIAARGGKAAHEKGTAHKFTTAEAREAGRKGGQIAAAKRLQG